MSVVMSGATAVKLFEAATEAYDATGTGVYRGFKLVAALQERGFELIFSEMPPKPAVATAEAPPSASELE